MKIDLIEKIIVFLVFAYLLGIGITNLWNKGSNPYAPPESGDASLYWQEAQSAIRGGSKSISLKPGFIYFESMFYLLFKKPELALMAIRVASVIIGGLTALMVYLIGRELFNKYVAMIALILLADHKFPIFEAGRLLTEPLYTFFCTAAILTTLWAVKNGKPRSFFISGLLYGLAIITRGEIKFFWLMLLVMIPLFYFNKWVWSENISKGNLLNLIKKGVVASIAIFLGSIIIITPVTVRNYFVSKKFALVSSDNGGEALWLGSLPTHMTRDFEGLNGPPLIEAIERNPILKEQWDAVWKQDGYLTPEGSKSYMKFALQNIKSFPEDFVYRSLRKLKIMLMLEGQGSSKSKVLLIKLVFVGIIISLIFMPNFGNFIIVLYASNHIFIHAISRARPGRDWTPFISLVTIFAAFVIYTVIKLIVQLLSKKPINIQVTLNTKQKFAVAVVVFILIGFLTFKNTYRHVFAKASNNESPYGKYFIKPIHSENGANYLQIHGFTNSENLVTIRVDDKEVYACPMQDRWKFQTFVPVLPGKHRVIVEFYNKAFIVSHPEETVLEIPVLHKNDTNKYAIGNKKCLNGNISEKKFKVIRNAAKYTYLDSYGNEFFPNVEGDQGGNSGWLKTGGDGPGFGNLTDSLNSTYDKDGRAVWLLSPNDQVNIVFDLRKVYKINQVDIQQYGETGTGFDNIMVFGSINNISNDWKLFSVKGNMSSKSDISLNNFHVNSRFIKISLSDPVPRNTQIIYDVKIYGEDVREKNV